MYPSPSFRHDKIFTAPEHIGSTRKLTGRRTSNATPPTSPAMGGGLGVRGGERGGSAGRQVEAEKAEKPQAGFQLRLCSGQLRGIRRSGAT